MPVEPATPGPDRPAIPDDPLILWDHYLRLSVKAPTLEKQKEIVDLAFDALRRETK